MNIRRLLSRTGLAGLAAAAVALTGMTLLTPSDAQAQSAARVESQTRPNFGVLLDPPSRGSRARGAHRRGNYGDHRPGYRPGPPRPGGEEVVLVDCGGNPGTGAVEDAVRRVRPGGTLIIRARGGACVGWLNIDKPMTILGEGRIDLDDWNRGIEPTLQAPDGYPCLSVAPGVRVEVRDIVFAAPQSGRAACIDGLDGEILLNNVGLRYAGDEAAIYAEGGLLDMRKVKIDAQTSSAAVVADRATLITDDVILSGALRGVEIVPGAERESEISRTRFVGPNTVHAAGANTIGLLIGGGRTFGRVTLNNVTICGYNDLVSVENGGVIINRSRLCAAQRGVVVYSGSAIVRDSRIARVDGGVVVGLGDATVVGNVFAGVYYPTRGRVEESNNRLWSRSEENCRPRPVQRYRDRYSLSWEDRGGYRCELNDYPRAWWEQDEGSYGYPYENYAYRPDQWDRYRDGWGWYDCNGRYVNDNRYRGDDRWSRGGWGRDRECRVKSNGPGFRLFPEIDAYLDVDAGLSIGW